MSTSLSSNTNILIIEPNLTGHRGPYLEWMTNSLAQITNQVTLLIPDSQEKYPSVSNIKKNIAEHNYDVQIISAKYYDWYEKYRGNNSLFGLLIREFYYWFLLNKWYKKHSNEIDYDIIFVPNLDNCLHLTGIIGSPFGSTAWSGLSMAPDFHYQKMGLHAPGTSLNSVKERLFFRLLEDQNIKSVFTTNEPLHDYSKKYTDKMYMLPEPTGPNEKMNKDFARKKLDLNGSRNYILLYGSITPRKGIESLLDSMLEPSFPTSTDLIMAGRISSVAHEILNTKKYKGLFEGKRIIKFDRFIEEKEESKLFSAADIVWLGYKNHYGPSGVLIQAVNAKRPIISCKEGVIGWQTQKHKIGRVIDIQNTRSITHVIVDLLEDIAAGNFASFPNLGSALGGTQYDAQIALKRGLI